MIFSKKAFTIQFSWIFILIVGFFVMFLVIRIITSQTDVSKQEINLDLSKNIDSILSSAEQSTDTFKIVHTPELKLTYLCFEDYTAYSVQKNINKIENSIMFSSSSISGRNIYTWTKEYKMPMKITNVLYVTDPLHKFIFVDGYPVIDYLLDLMPSNITREVVNSINDITDNNYNQYIIMTATSLSGTILNGFSPMFLRKIIALQITTVPGQENKGQITFYKFDDNGQSAVVGENEYDYIDETLLFGAIFTADPYLYNCTANKLFEKSKSIYQIYNYTATKMNQATTRVICKDPSRGYLSVISILEDMITSDSSNTIYEDAIQLRSRNTYLQRSDCPLAY